MVLLLVAVLALAAAGGSSKDHSKGKKDSKDLRAKEGRVLDAKKSEFKEGHNKKCSGK